MGMNETSKEIDHGKDYARLRVIAKFPVKCLLSLFFWQNLQISGRILLFQKKFPAKFPGTRVAIESDESVRRFPV
jgi:hypothetical protein